LFCLAHLEEEEKQSIKEEATKEMYIVDFFFYSNL
jgi:hypothetical protein